MKLLPALKVAIFLALGITIGGWIEDTSYLLTAIVIIALLVPSIVFKTSVSNILTILSLVMAGFFIYHASTNSTSFSPFQSTLTGRIIEQPVERFGNFSFPLSLQSIQPDGGEPFNARGKVWVTGCTKGDQVKYGTVIAIPGVLFPLRPQRNPGQFNLKAWRERNGYIAEFRCSNLSSPTVVDERLPFIYQVRNRILKSAERFGGDNAPLMKALLIGMRRDLDPELVESLRHTGLSHLLALSGLHVGFLVGILIGLAAVFRAKPHQRAMIAIIGLVLFLLLVPPRGSTLRAVIMATVLLSGPLFRKWNTPLNSLAFSAVIILLIRPADLFDAGFQLSFAAAGGIIIFHRRIFEIRHLFRLRQSRWMRRLTLYIIIPFLISIAATVMVLPFTSIHFGTMAIATPLFNLLAIPLLYFIYSGSWLIIVVSSVWTWGAALLADGLNGMIEAWKWLTVQLSMVSPLIYVRLAPVTVMLTIATIILFARQQHLTIRRIAVAVLIIANLLLLDSLRPVPARFQAWFLDVGFGDAAVWRFPQGRIAVIDGGPQALKGRTSTIVEVLRYFRCERVDLLVATHPEADHIGGLIELMEEFPIGLAITSPCTANTDTYHKFIEISDKHNVEWKTATAGTTIDNLHNSSRVTAYNPPAGIRNWSLNDMSVVLMLEIYCDTGDTVRHLTTGDIEKKSENFLVGRGGIHADLLKVPHHGSYTSCRPDFLQAVSPRCAVISCGRSYADGVYNRLQIPIDHLESNSIDVHTTSDEGAVLCELSCEDGIYGWKVTDWRHPAFFRWFFGLS